MFFFFYFCIQYKGEHETKLQTAAYFKGLLGSMECPPKLDGPVANLRELTQTCFHQRTSVSYGWTLYKNEQISLKIFG